MASLTLIRHAESQANRDGIWQGTQDGDLSSEGEASLDVLGKRLAGRRFDLVISSPLTRARRTTESFTSVYEVEEQWREMHLGEWEGMSREEILARDGDYLWEAIDRGDLPLGRGGETLRELGHRAVAAVEALAQRLGEHGSAAVVTHGGVLQALLEWFLPARGRRVHSFVANASLTRIEWTWGRPRLAVFNDLGHFGPRPPSVTEHLEVGEPVLALIRHGQTRANVEGRWQGQGDWGLDEVGHAQAEALRDWYGQAETVYASPLGRAQITASYLATGRVVTVEGLKELGMGIWEGMTGDEIREGWPEKLETIYREGVDLRRGETGESWGELTSRFRNAIHGLEPDRDRPTLVVAHGGAIRSYVSSLGAGDDTHSESLFTPNNTAVTHVALTATGPRLLDYAVATHLEGLD